MREAVVGFFDRNDAGLIGVLEQSEREGSPAGQRAGLGSFAAQSSAV